MDSDEQFIQRLVNKVFQSDTVPSASMQEQAKVLYEKYVALRLAGFDMLDAVFAAAFWIPRDEDDA